MKLLIPILLLYATISSASAQGRSGIITYELVQTTTIEGVHLDDNGPLPPELLHKITGGRAIGEQFLDTNLVKLYFTDRVAWHDFERIKPYRHHQQEEKTNLFLDSKVTSFISRTYADSSYYYVTWITIGPEGKDFSDSPMDSIPDNLKIERKTSGLWEGFEQTGEEKIILGYTCQEWYKSSEGVSIWLYQGKEFPSMSQQGFRHPDSKVQGTVLAWSIYSEENESIITSATAIDIDFCLLDELALYHTPLTELRPEDVILDCQDE